MPEPPVVLITGCSSGIGKATALAAAARGHRVYATARDPASLRDLESGGPVRTLALDVTDTGSIGRAVATVLGEAGRLDALVNNAGYGQYGAVEDVTAEEWRHEFDVNLFGAVEVTRAVLPAMRQARSGTIVNVSSVAGKIAIPFAAPYCASKHALEAVSDALRVELRPWGIKVACIEPGSIATPLWERGLEQFDKQVAKMTPEALELYGDLIPRMRKLTERTAKAGIPPARVADAVEHALTSPRPKTRYLVGNDARGQSVLRLLPDKGRDALLARVVGIRLKT